jgi:copper chaperone CopZ
MNRRVFCRSGLFALAALANGKTLWAASPGTEIEVDNMHCSNCARKIASKLYGVPGVVGVRTNVTANTATVTPQQQRQPSPKALWEAVERAGFKPVKLQGPQGVFTSKPEA